ncbi:MAG: hypothetical protein AWU54_466 [Candidatus Frackibacter sp. T328-2]|jgi:F420-non-reducing hydrogenase iron-sulfur subunit|nr:MAG: hypothetical protein AWU54_466 [Candidatus Frackibacter sp. T328-2]
MLPQFGIEPERFMLTWVSANEGEKFAEVVKDLVAKVKLVGPLGKVSERTGGELIG